MSFAARNHNRNFKAAISPYSIQSNFTSSEAQSHIMFEIRYGAEESIKQLRVSYRRDSSKAAIHQDLIKTQSSRLDTYSAFNHQHGRHYYNAH
jgi:hypothetical protein